MQDSLEAPFSIFEDKLENKSNYHKAADTWRAFRAPGL